jgi:hypothetical protein
MDLAVEKKCTVLSKEPYHAAEVAPPWEAIHPPDERRTHYQIAKI